MQTFKQLSIFDLFDEALTNPKPERELQKGDTTFLVNKCEKIECHVLGIYTLTSGKVAFLSSSDGKKTYEVSMKEVGRSLFKNEGTADEHITENKETYDCIFSDQMNIKDFRTYRSSKNDDVKAFFCILDNGYVYIKNFFSVPHIVRIDEDDLEEFEQAFYEEHELYGFKKYETSEAPLLENMYRCRNHKDWLYASCQSPYIE